MTYQVNLHSTNTSASQRHPSLGRKEAKPTNQDSTKKEKGVLAIKQINPRHKLQ